MQNPIDSDSEQSQNRTVPAFQVLSAERQTGNSMAHDFGFQHALHTSAPQDSRSSLKHEFSCRPTDIHDLVHDLRQPLSTIECLTFYLELTLTDNETRLHLARIQEMVSQANRILEGACTKEAN